MREEHDREKETRRNGRIYAALDGSGDHPREDRLRRCGHALFYGKGYPWNLEKALNGQAQTVPRSELRVFLAVPRRLEFPNHSLM